MKRFRVDILEVAHDEIEAIDSYISAANPEAAQRNVATLFGSFAMFSFFPRMGRESGLRGDCR